MNVYYGGGGKKCPTHADQDRVELIKILRQVEKRFFPPKQK